MVLLIVPFIIDKKLNSISSLYNETKRLFTTIAKRMQSTDVWMTQSPFLQTVCVSNDVFAMVTYGNI